MGIPTTKSGKRIIHTPRWILWFRILQLKFSTLTFILGAVLIHGVYENAWGFAVLCGLLTWIVTLYEILSERVRSCQPGYNTWAVLALDGFMMLLWLTCMGVNAAYRAEFNIPVKTDDCYNNGDLVNSEYCDVYTKRSNDAVVANTYVLDAVIVLSGLLVILFVTTFAYICHHFRLAFKAEGGGGVYQSMPNPGQGAQNVDGYLWTFNGAPPATMGMTPQQVGPQQVLVQSDVKWTTQPNIPVQVTGVYDTSMPQAQQPFHGQFTNVNTGYTGAPQQAIPSTGQPHAMYGYGSQVV
ncbi:hypothetical protein BX600DRAFT_516346 [Xylariales sp. PMI_506]|nr:hypothetical protein BX600DRAFT_516346 [Xylariales sp. PMI_506]